MSYTSDAATFSKREEREYRYRRLLPYGMLQTEDGRKIIFNRNYDGLFEMSSEGVVRSGSDDDWRCGRGFRFVEFYYIAENQPWDRGKANAAAKARCEAIWADWASRCVE